MNTDRERREWAERLETEQEDDELLALAARLRRAGDETRPAPPLAFQQQLRRDLLNQYDAPVKRSAGLWRWVGSAAALAMLALAVVMVWLSVGSAGRPSLGADNTAPASEYTYLDYSITGGLVLESTQTDGGDFQTQGMMLPGVDVGVVTRWGLPLASAAVIPFVHLLDGEGRIVAETDGGTLTDAEGAGQTAVAATLSLSLPADLAPGRYELVGGLYDAVTGARLPISTPQGEVTAVSLDQYEVLGQGSAPEFDVVIPENAPRVTVIPSNSPESSSAGTTVSNFLTVHDVAPAADTVLSGTAPLHFRIVFSYALDTLSSAFLEVQVVELQGGTTGERRLGRATADLGARNGSLEVEVIVDPTSTLYGLTGPADLGLRFEAKPDATSDASDVIPLVIETPGDLRWRYEP